MRYITTLIPGKLEFILARSLSSEIEPVKDSSDSSSPQAMTEPVPVEFVPIDVIAEGRMELGVTGVENGQWVVTVGQDLLSEGRGRARVRNNELGAYISASEPPA
ncbi:hypothetical protein [Rhodohalobacter sp.]|uniref:hypothetical protein n=1 Tax=Rhodohalobacter sp. TaxID=1974210 RepID=UPI002ACE9B1E|nr:hypothetical protein [Rhodohalobacter sp.]MDZ7756273.1 hypothetical protein [Rhodohalobacter sp.]